MSMRTLAAIMAKRPRTVILVFTIFTVLVGLQARNLYMEADYANYLSQDDPVLKLYNQINKEFKMGSTIIILINQSTRSYDVREYEILREMDEIYRTLYEQPHIHGEENGIISIKSLSVLIRNENAKNPPVELGGGNGVDDIPTDPNVISDYLARTQISSMKGILFTDDYKYAVIIIQLDDNADFDSVLSKTKDAIENRGTKYANMVITGTIAMQKANQMQSMKNLLVIFPIAILFTAVVLFYFHRTPKGILIAFLPVVFTLILTFGTLGVVFPQLSILSVAIVALLLGLGVDYSIYLMNRLSEEKNIEDKITRIEKTLRSTGKAVLLSSVTTIIGFSSLTISSMAPMVSFGFGCAVGILYSFMSAMILVPCLVILLKFEKTTKVPNWTKIANIVLNNRKRIILIACFFAILSVSVLPQIKTDVNYHSMVPKGIPETEAMLEYGDKFGNGGNFNAFLVETDPYGLEDPEVINAIYNMEEIMRLYGATVSSIADPLKEIHEILDRNTIVEKFSNITDADKIIFDKIAKEGIVNEDHSKTLIIVTLPVGTSIQKIEKTVNQLNLIAANTVIPRNGKVSILTGQDAIYVAVNNKLKDEQTRSMFLAIILVLAALIIIFNSTAYGFLTMIPVFFVLMWEPGFLVATNIPLSPVTITIASIMIGVGIDYGIHITHRYREELANGKSNTDAIKASIEKTGFSLIEAAFTTSAGIAAILVVNISALNEFVYVIIFMVAVSVIGAAMLLPAIYRLKPVKK